MEKENKTKGKVVGIVANLVMVEVEGPVAQNEICFISLGQENLMAEVIKVVGKIAYVQVFESTRGLKPGSAVTFEGHLLEVTLGPGILSRNYDGLQNDLDKMEGIFLKRGEYTDPLNREKKWIFKPLAQVGDEVQAGDWLGEVDENGQPHKIMVPFKMKGTFTIQKIAGEGEYTVDHTIASITDGAGE
ncbi:MAG: V-type ATP synthase subunit A, partial [Mariniphaga sp.]|nr:V-type ATP synthase subunit A [Mariniphaga sp.]